MEEKTERSFNVGVLGENQELNTLIGQAFGAPGTKSDLQFFNRLDESLGYVFCAVMPVDYPEKIKPMLQTLTMTDIYVLVIDLNFGLNPVIGELLVAIDLFTRLYNKRLIITINNIKNNEWKLDDLKKKLKNILNTTNLHKIEVFEVENKDSLDLLKEKVVKLGINLLDQEEKEEINSYTKILIDHVFPVKGIGTVALGVVKAGVLKKGQLLELVGFNGGKKKIIIKNIQKQDRNFNIAYKNDRVGLALKGVAVNEISRDNMLATPDIFKKEQTINAEVYLSEFYKPKEGKIIPGDNKQYYGLSNMQLTPLKFIEGSEIYPGSSGSVKITFDKPLYHDGSGISGIITELNKFENKLRILGHFIQK